MSFRFNMKSSHNKKKNKRRKPKNQTLSTRASRASEYVYGASLQVRGPAPDSMLVDLFYQDTVMNRNNVGGTVCSWRYRTNGAYDPDPLLGSGSLSGFVEWSAFYTHYRVINFGFDVQVANNESFPLVVLSAPTVVDIGANYSSLDQISEFPYGKKSLISAKTGDDKCRLKGTVNIARMEGVKEVLYDSTFAATVTTIPSQPRWFNVGFTGGSSVLVNGVLVSIRLRFQTLFFGRTNVPS